MSARVPARTRRPPAVAGTLRWARAGVVSAGAWMMASAAHVLGGGHLPAPWVVLALVALGAGVTSPALHRRAGLGRLVLLLGAGQVGMHAGLVLGSRAAAPAVAGAGHPAPAPAGGPGLSHAHGLAEPAGGMTAGMPLLPTPGMALAHLAAAVVFGLLLVSGERSLFSLLALLAWAARPQAWLRGLVTLPVVVGPAALRRAEAAEAAFRRHRRPRGRGRWPAAPRFLPLVVPRRGPPQRPSSPVTGRPVGVLA